MFVVTLGWPVRRLSIVFGNDANDTDGDQHSTGSSDKNVPVVRK
jgi:hypothetical protein